MREMRCGWNISAGNPEGNRPFGRSRSRWKDDIKTDL
jgi:hypothetical protein